MSLLRRCKALIEILQRSNADVICLQEVTPGFLDRLLHQNWVQRFYACSDIPSGESLKFGSGEQYGVVILAKLHLRPKFCMWGLPTHFGRRLVTAQLAVASSSRLLSMPSRAGTQVLGNGSTPHECAAATPLARGAAAAELSFTDTTGTPLVQSSMQHPGLNAAAATGVTLPVVVGTVHLDSREGNTATRMAQLQKIFPILQTLRESAGAACPLFLAGDFNIFQPETETREIPTEFVDMWRFLSPGKAGITMSANHGYSDSRPDRILLSPACCSSGHSAAVATPSQPGGAISTDTVLDLQPQSMEIIGTQPIPVAVDGMATSVNTPSDHYGLLATLALQPASPAFVTATKTRLLPQCFSAEHDDSPHRRSRPDSSKPSASRPLLTRQYSQHNEFRDTVESGARPSVASPNTPLMGPASPADAPCGTALPPAAAPLAYPSTPAPARSQAVPASAAAAGIEAMLVYTKTPSARREEYVCSVNGERGRVIPLPDPRDSTVLLGGALNLHQAEECDVQPNAPSVQPHARGSASAEQDHCGLDTSGLSHGSAHTEVYDRTSGRARVQLGALSMSQPAFSTPTQGLGGGAAPGSTTGISALRSGMQSLTVGSGLRPLRRNLNATRSSPMLGAQDHDRSAPPAIPSSLSMVGAVQSRFAAASVCQAMVPPLVPSSRVVHSAGGIGMGGAMAFHQHQHTPQSSVGAPPPVQRTRQADGHSRAGEFIPQLPPPEGRSASGSGSSQEELQGMQGGFSSLTISTAHQGADSAPLISSSDTSPGTFAGGDTPLQFGSLSFGLEGGLSSALPTPRAGHESVHSPDALSALEDHRANFCTHGTPERSYLRSTVVRDLSQASGGIEAPARGCRMLSGDSLGGDDDIELDDAGGETHRGGIHGEMHSAAPPAVCVSAGSPSQSESSAGKRVRDAFVATQGAATFPHNSVGFQRSASQSALDFSLSRSGGAARQFAQSRRDRARTSPRPSLLNAHGGPSASLGAVIPSNMFRASPVPHGYRRPATASPTSAAGGWPAGALGTVARLHSAHDDDSQGHSTPSGYFVPHDGADLVQPSPNKMSKGAQSEDCGSALGRDCTEVPSRSALAATRQGAALLHPQAQLAAQCSDLSGTSGRCSRSKRTHSQSLEDNDLLQGFSANSTYEAAASAHGDVFESEPAHDSYHRSSSLQQPSSRAELAAAQTGPAAAAARSRAATAGFDQHSLNAHTNLPGSALADSLGDSPPAAFALSSMASSAGDSSHQPTSGASTPSTSQMHGSSARMGTPVSLTARAAAGTEQGEGQAQAPRPLLGRLNPNTLYISTSGVTPARKQARQ